MKSSNVYTDIYIENLVNAFLFSIYTLYNA